MTPKETRITWTRRILLTGLIAAGVSITTIAQPVESPVPKTRRLDKIEKLIAAGQLTMFDAVKMAEAHCKGVAFNAECFVRPGPFAPTDARLNSGEPAIGDSERLEYRITCVLKNNPITVLLDGKEKKVISPPETPPGPRPDPTPVPPPGL